MKDWKSKKLSEVCAKITDGTHQTPKYFNEGIIFLSSKNVTSGKIDWNNIKYIDEKQHLEMHKRVAPKVNDVLLAKNGTTGVAAIVDRNITFDIYVSLALLRPLEGLLPTYLLHFINSPLAKKQFNKRLKGIGVPNLHLEEIREVEIPLPPLLEQKRIVSILDEAFAATARAKANAEQNLKNAKEVFESYLQVVFQKPLHNWEVCNVEDHIKLIDYRGRTPVKTNSGVRLITAKNIKLGYLQLDPQEFIDADKYYSWMSRGIPKFGDVIFTTEAPLANVAQIETQEKLAFAQRVIVMQPNRNKIDPTFLKFMLLSKPIRSNILSRGTGATVLGIKSSLLKKIEIYFPKSIKEQQEIVQKLNTISIETKKLEVIYEQKISSLEELKKSILQKAFKGELKTTEPIPA
jgi:type I restriction enzyme S subunit